MKQYNSVINSIFDFCIKSNVNFVFISGNGGSGKSTFSKNLKKCFEENGLVANLVDTDDFPQKKMSNFFYFLLPRC